MIKERIALLKEIRQQYSNIDADPLEILTVYQEVCKDDRQQKIFNSNGKKKVANEPATDKQVNLMIKMKIPPGKYTKAEASRLIDEKIHKKEEQPAPEGWK